MRVWLLVCAMAAVAVAAKSSGTVKTWNGTLQYDEDWGYVTVRNKAHSFWWLYSVKPAYNRPLILWLQGGPGASSTGFGNMEETGPKDLNENDRTSTWLQVADLVYVDNPVGAGFSYVDDNSALTANVQQIGQDLLTWAVHFFNTHPEYKSRPFYIFCESYGGKMSAEFARQIVEAKKSGLLSINFKAVALGDSWISAMDYVNTWGPYLYQNSYLDDKQLSQVQQMAGMCQKLVDNAKWSQATDCWGNMEDLISQVTNGVSWYNILKYGGQDDWSKKRRKRGASYGTLARMYKRHVAPLQTDQMSDYMNTVARKKFGIIPDNVKFGAQSGDVFNAQSGDFMTPNWQTVDGLLKEGVQVIVYNGALDLICDTAGTEAWVNRLTWEGLAKYQQAPKIAFKTASFPLAGYVKQWDNLSFYYILRAGHMVAHDTEESAIYMLNKVMKDTA